MDGSKRPSSDFKPRSCRGCGPRWHERERRPQERDGAGMSAGTDMSVTVNMHGNLRRFMPEGRNRVTMDVAPDTSIAALLASIGADRDTWLVAVNGVACELHRVLQEGDLLDCFEPVA